MTSIRDAKGVEAIQPGEKEKVQQVSDQFNRFQMMNFNEHMHCLRGTHLKTQGVSHHIHLLKIAIILTATVCYWQVDRPR